MQDEALSACLMLGSYSVPAIQQRLKEEDVIVTKRSLYRCMIKEFKEKGVYTNLQRRARDKKFNPDNQQNLGLTDEVRDPLVSSRAN